MFRNKAVGAMILMVAAGVAVSGTGLAQASATRAPAAHAAVVGARATVRTPAFVQKAAPADTFSCYGPVSILSNANLDWVSAELAYWGNGYAMLRARSTGIGGWEQFTFCHDVTSNYWAFYNDANGDFVTAEIGYTGSDYGMLRARATSIGPWEQYSLSCTASGVAIKSNANNMYVSAELGYGGSSYAELRARASAVGPWEQYTIPNLPC